MGSDVKLRDAVREDAPALARLFLASSHGLSEHVWRQAALPGETPLQSGIRRYARDGGPFTWRCCLVAESGGRAAAMLHAFPMEEAVPDIGEDPVLRPYAELHDPGSLRVSDLAVFPEFRGRGIGTLLLAAAEERAWALGLARLSLTCFERNEGALRLYLRLGFREADRRPVVPHPCLRIADGDVMLMRKAVGPATGSPWPS